VLRRLALIAILIAAPAATARAEATYATLAANLTATAQTSGAVQFFPLVGTTFAQRFTTATLPAIGDGDDSGQVLYSFGWNLLPAQTFIPPEGFSDVETTYAVNLRVNEAGVPGASLLTLGPATGSLLTPGVMEFFYADLVADPSIALQSNTPYWITVAFQSANPGAGTALLLPFTTDSNQTGPGTVDNLMVNTGSGWSGLSERAIVQVQVETVPEPSAIALAAAAFAFLASRRRSQGVSRPWASRRSSSVSSQPMQASVIDTP